MVYTLRFFSSSKCSLFRNSNIFDSCIIHILYTGCAKIKKNNSGAKRLIDGGRIKRHVPHTSVEPVHQVQLQCIVKCTESCRQQSKTRVHKALKLLCVFTAQAS